MIGDCWVIESGGIVRLRVGRFGLPIVDVFLD